MKYTYNDVKRTFTPDKAQYESSFSRFFHIRPISFLISVPLANAGIKPTTISIVSVIVSVLVFVLFSIPSSITRLIAVLFVPIWNILDCVDGNIARVTKTFAKYGSAVDAMSGYYINAFLPIGLGIASFNVGANFPNISEDVFIIFGALGSIFNLLGRLLYQKFNNETLKNELTDNESVKQKSAKHSSIRRTQLYSEFSLTGFPMFILLLAPIFNLFGLLAIYYMVFNGVVLLLFTQKYMKMGY